MCQKALTVGPLPPLDTAAAKAPPHQSGPALGGFRLWSEDDPRPFHERKAEAVAFFQTLALLCSPTPSRDAAN